MTVLSTALIAVWSTLVLLAALRGAWLCGGARDGCEAVRAHVDVEQRLPKRLRLTTVAAPDALGDCVVTDVGLRLRRLHTLFNAQRTVPFVCDDASLGDVMDDAAADDFLVCAELRRQLLLQLGFSAPTVPVSIAPLAKLRDRLFGHVYLADVRVRPQPGVEHTYQVIVVDDARYQLQFNFFDDNPNVPMVLIMALHNRGTQLAQWVTALTRSRANQTPGAVKICVADFGSTDIDVRQQLNRTGWEYRLLRMQGKFSKTMGLNACLDTIKNPLAIVFTTDVDVALPPDFETRIRRFVRPGRQIYAPVVMYENCTWTSGECWGDGGYGLVAFVREDADPEKAGPYDEAVFNYREGFEDTDFLLRLYRLPRMIVRRREHDFVHRWHPPSPWLRESNRGSPGNEPVPQIC